MIHGIRSDTVGVGSSFAMDHGSITERWSLKFRCMWHSARRHRTIAVRRIAFGFEGLVYLVAFDGKLNRQVIDVVQCSCGGLADLWHLPITGGLEIADSATCPIFERWRRVSPLLGWYAMADNASAIPRAQARFGRLTAL